MCISMRGFHDIPDNALFTAREVAERMGFTGEKGWTALYKWCWRLGLARPERIRGTKMYRGHELKVWFACLPSGTEEVITPAPARPAAPPETGPSLGQAGTLIPPQRLVEMRALLRARG
jgi:hypothetical protein